MKTKSVLLLVFFTLLSVLSVNSHNGYRHSKQHSRNCYYNGRFEYSYIPNLTVKQKQKIEKICLERDRKVSQLNYKIKELRRDLNRFTRSRYANAKSIEKMRKRIYSCEKEIDQVNYKADSKIYSLLTRSQRMVYASVN